MRRRGDAGTRARGNEGATLIAASPGLPSRRFSKFRGLALTELSKFLALQHDPSLQFLPIVEIPH